MTQLRKFRDSVSNYFDEIERGIGKRGDGEPLDKAQAWAMRDLAKLPRCTVWLARKRDDGRIGMAVIVSNRKVPPEERITVREYQRRLEQWWFPERYPPSNTKTSGITAADIPW